MLGHRRLRRVRRGGGLFRLPLRGAGRRFDAALGRAEARARHRRRNLQSHPRLGGSHHLRPVRRRRGRHRASRRPTPRTKAAVASSRPSSTPMGVTTNCSMSMAGPRTTGTVGKLRMKGREVFRHAVVNLAAVMNETLVIAGLSNPPMSIGSCRNQANARILDATSRKLGLPPREGRRHRRSARQHIRRVGAAGARHRGAATGACSRARSWCSRRWAAGFTWGAAVVRF